LLSVTTRAITSEEREKVIVRAQLRPRNPILGGFILFFGFLGLLVLAFFGAIASHLVSMAIDFQFNPTKIPVSDDFRSPEGMTAVFTNPYSYIGVALVFIIAIVVSINQRHRFRGWSIYQRDVADALKRGEVEAVTATADDVAYIQGSGDDVPGFYLLAVDAGTLLAIEETPMAAQVQAGAFPAAEISFTRLVGRHEIIELSVDGEALSPSMTHPPLAAHDYLPYHGEIMQGTLANLDAVLCPKTASPAQEPS
jgi:hypothetical protein